MRIFLLAVFSFIQLSQCWPDFYYFSRNHTNGSLLVNGSLTGSSFNKTLKTRFIVHGFNDNTSEPFLLTLKDGLLSIRDVNVILVDWAAGAIGPLSRYPIAASNAKIVGTKLANFIKQNNISAASSYCIGHSLGAHSCGFAGKALTTKFGRITGLDPAAPLFDLSDPKKRLDKTDASFVDCIHTSLLGIQEPICHQDYYPNGGYSQPGCPDITDFGDCSHWRSLEYFIETIIGSCEYKSVPCDNYVDYTNGLCPCNTTSKCPEMGYYSYEYNVTGSFYLDTINATPYCSSANVLYRGWNQLFYTLFIFILTTLAFSSLLN